MLADLKFIFHAAKSQSLTGGEKCYVMLSLWPELGYENVDTFTTLAAGVAGPVDNNIDGWYEDRNTEPLSYRPQSIEAPTRGR